MRLAPRSVIDVGAGFGLYGALCRNYLDAMHGRCMRHMWEVRIDAIEAHGAYSNPLWQMYNCVLRQDFTALERLSHASCDMRRLWLCNYDLALMIDSLEHLTPNAGAEFLRKLVDNNRHVIVSVPNGPMEQGAAHGNEYETHRTTYHGPELLEAYPGARYLHQGVCIVLSIPGNLK